ncbi:MAG TPA: DUF3078 domain-containing protein [Bacteroidales bacterium]|jgi:hypothetical protein|nr:DUF3078 domain-containing protein [Bacteroidales bacterium]
MKKTYLSITILALSLTLFTRAAEPDTVKHWKFKSETNIGFSQLALTNWSAGGENSLATNSLLSFFLDYHKNKFTWNNFAGFGYGVQKQESFTNWRKTDDKIDLSTKAGIYAARHWDYTALLNFKTQFADGYKYINNDERVMLSQFMAPGYLQLALGMEYKPADYFSMLLSPIGARMTFVNNDSLSAAGAFGVEKGEKTLTQMGGSVNALFKKDILKNVNLLSKLGLFSNYLKNPECIIVNWENVLLMKVNKYISTTIGTTLIYDDNIDIIDKKGINIGPATQFKEAFTVGFVYSFSK